MSQSNQDATSTNFPAFRLPNGIIPPNSISWQGTFIGAVDGMSKGPTGGPTVFFDSDDPDLSTVVVGPSTPNNMKSFSAGSGSDYIGNPSFAPGLSGRISSVPPGFEQCFLFHRAAGITRAVQQWGAAILHGKPGKIYDVTLDKIGYQTDNGAAYVFPNTCGGGDCSAALVEKNRELRENGAPMSYLSYQGSGSSTSDGSAPWCVSTWGPDIKTGSGAYPLTLPELHEAIGFLDLQLYAPYFCPNSPYFDTNNSTNPSWPSVASNKNLTGCTAYDFLDVDPSQSYEFYTWLFQKGSHVGMVSFEPDFMNQNYNCVEKFVETTDSVEHWQRGMARAAYDRNITLQWCMTTPTDVLASTNYPALTNFRVSSDFCYGESWDIGISSLLVWALGGRPSKDTLWTTANNRTEVAGCPWTPDHDAHAAPLHLALALMSCGPVGISDLNRYTNYPLLKRAITLDGTLLQPSKSITTVDSFIAKTQGIPDQGYLLSTHCDIAVEGHGTRPLLNIFVSFKMSSATYSLRDRDFFPALNMTDEKLMWRQRTNFFDEDRSCKNGTVSSTSCGLHSVDSASSITIPLSNSSEYSPTITYVYRRQTCGWIVLGEVDKLVPLSPKRFIRFSCVENDSIDVTMRGAVGESVRITAVDPLGCLVVRDAFFASGSTEALVRLRVCG